MDKNKLALTEKVINDNVNTIWYLESNSSNRLNPVQGSAVAIRLQETGKPHTAISYLLTCAHVIRDSIGAVEGVGPILPEIHAWAPNTGYQNRQRKKMKVFQEIKPYETFDLDNHLLSEHWDNISYDWVILSFIDSGVGKSVKSVPRYGDDSLSVLNIYGIPGGKTSFHHDGIIKPILLPGDVNYKGEGFGALLVNSSQGAPGVSGGGVFKGGANTLIGIHRSKTTSSVELQAVSINHIQSVIEEQGYSFTQKQASKKMPDEINGGFEAPTFNPYSFEELCKYLSKLKRIKILKWIFLILISYFLVYIYINSVYTPWPGFPTIDKEIDNF